MAHYQKKLEEFTALGEGSLVLRGFWRQQALHSSYDGASWLQLVVVLVKWCILVIMS